MANRVNIFISASSSDLRTLRQQVTVWLLDMGWHPVVQDHFETHDDKTVIQMLREEIKGSDAVLHIIGQHYGAEPQSPPKGGSRKSYTQLEADLALKLRKRLFIVLLDEDFPCDPHEPEPQDRQILQQAYRLQIATGERLYIPSSTPADLEPKIRKLRVEIDKLNRSRRHFALLLALPLVAALALAVHFWHSRNQDNAARSDEQKKLETLVMDSAGSGAASVQALAELRKLLRADNPDIDTIPAEKLPGLVKKILDDLQKPSARPADFSGTVKQVLTEAQADADHLRFSDGAEKLDKELARFDAEDAERTRGHAALLAERGRFFRLQLQYREAAKYYQQAANIAGIDPKVAQGYLIDAADSLYAQGDEFGDNQAILDAIQAYSSAAPQRERDPLEWAKIQHKLANALERLGERESETTHLEKAVAAYSEVIEVRNREHDQSGWAAAKNDLAYALLELGERENGSARFEAARDACMDALKVLTQPQDAPLRAAVQNNLGNALFRLGETESTTLQLEGAVQAYTEALKVRTPKDAPFEWAATNSNRALALEALGQRETGTAKLEQAVAAHKEVLTVRTRERLPLEWAKTQDNLGLALESLGERESGTAHLEEAVGAFNAALEVQTRKDMPYVWAETQNSLGFALEALGKRETGTARLEAAVTAITEALTVNTREHSPTDWAMTQDNLGNALVTLGQRETAPEAGTARLKAAVAAFNEALKEYTPDSSSVDWASTQNDLGNALKALGERETGTADLEAAVAAFSEALKVRTRDQVPLDWAASIGDQGIAQMLLAKRKGDAGMAKAAIEKIEVAYTTTQSGGDSAGAAYYSARLTESRAIIDQLTKR
jgi:tetratricopeptide (TPR) repeat protein